MADLGIISYGYTEKDAEKIKTELEKTLNEGITLFGAAESDNFIVKSILENPEKSSFKESKNKFIMFLGFSNDDIKTALTTFPGEITRPIFCGLTENNMSWKVNYLMEHLLEEQAAVKSAK